MPAEDHWLAMDEPAAMPDDFMGRELSFGGPQCAQGLVRTAGPSCGNCTRTSLGLLLMFGMEYECAWPRWLLGTLYLLLLCWAFIGIAVVSNIFMESIERITARKLTRPKKGGAKGEVDTILMWNPTVANLTLMALGSSAPEIILAILEIVLNGFQAGELGPGTIVGSAAFNMLIITAVCIIAVPSPQVPSRLGEGGKLVGQPPPRCDSLSAPAWQHSPGAAVHAAAQWFTPPQHAPAPAAVTGAKPRPPAPHEMPAAPRPGRGEATPDALVPAGCHAAPRLTSPLHSTRTLLLPSHFLSQVLPPVSPHPPHAARTVDSRSVTEAHPAYPPAPAARPPDSQD
jgi:hypothetical protein